MAGYDLADTPDEHRNSEVSALQTELRRQLMIRHDAIVAGWHDIVTSESFVAVDATALHEQLGALTDRVITWLLAPQAEPGEAEAIGQALAQLHYVRPEALGRTLELLGQSFGSGMSPACSAAVQPWIGTLLGGMATGFVRQAQESLLTEQDKIHEALLAARSRAEEALRASEARYRAVVTQASEGVVLADVQTGRIIEANRAFTDLLGYTGDELRGTSIFAIVAHPRKSIERNTRQALLQGQHYVGERRCRRKDGTLVSVETSLTPIYTDGGPVLCVVARDSTERLQAAAELAEARRGMAAGREAERLRLAQELHDGAVQDLLGLRYGLLTAFGENAATHKISAGMIRVVHRLRDIVTELRPPVLDDQGLVAALKDYIGSLPRDGNDLPLVTLHAPACDDALPQSMALTLFRVAQEAIRNAQTHAQAGRIAVQLRPRTGTVILRVIDNGRGFAVPERLNSLASDKHFGLAGIEERVVWEHGRLRVRSRPGRGTTVTVWLPLDGEKPSECEQN